MLGTIEQTPLNMLLSNTHLKHVKNAPPCPSLPCYLVELVGHNLHL
jgi:hypothetical protein